MRQDLEPSHPRDHKQLRMLRISESSENTMLDESLDQSPDDPSRAHCAVCHRIMPVTRAGLVRVHGPVGNRCPGSRNRPRPTRLDQSLHGQTADLQPGPAFDPPRLRFEPHRTLASLWPDSCSF